MAAFFPKIVDKYIRIGGIVATLGAVAGIALFSYWTYPTVLRTGYQPVQPLPYSHKLHAGNMGMDCYYCHYTVYKAAYAAIPPSQVCMNCHAKVRTDSPLLEKVRDSYTSGQPVPWVRVHKLAAYVYFNHSAHINSGVSCVSCHGRVDQMAEVRQVKPLNMAFCLDCHRNPAPNLRPVEYVTKLDWTPPNGEDPAAIGRRIMDEKHINPPVNCSGCHR
jgi:menaquinone reductase, multiheme cytochrome c subunit